MDDAVLRPAILKAGGGGGGGYGAGYVGCWNWLRGDGLPVYTGDERRRWIDGYWTIGTQISVEKRTFQMQKARRHDLWNRFGITC